MLKFLVACAFLAVSIPASADEFTFTPNMKKQVASIIGDTLKQPCTAGDFSQFGNNISLAYSCGKNPPRMASVKVRFIGALLVTEEDPCIFMSKTQNYIQSACALDDKFILYDIGL